MKFSTRCLLVIVVAFKEQPGLGYFNKETTLHAPPHHP